MKRFILTIWTCLWLHPLAAQSFEAKVEGMLLGSVIGDAAGAPFEFFYPAQRSYWSTAEKVLTEAGHQRLKERFKLHDHFRKASSFGQWKDYAGKGTITDDTRLKVIFMNLVRKGGSLNANALAREIKAFSSQIPVAHQSLCNHWLAEIRLAAEWQLGQRENALPPDRLWAGAPGIAGQMMLIPLAALAGPEPETVYKTAWELDFLENGMARDINSAIITGLSEALKPGADWQSIETVMRSTDPYGYAASHYGDRKLIYWLDLAHALVQKANGNVARLFDLLENKLEAKLWWECWVPLVVVCSIAKMADYQPLTAMQLCIEFGHDTDSYAQLMGAFMGALHGPGIFPEDMAQKVQASLKTDFGEDLKEWTQQLVKSTK